MTVCRICGVDSESDAVITLSHAQIHMIMSKMGVGFASPNDKCPDLVIVSAEYFEELALQTGQTLVVEDREGQDHG